MIGTRWSNRTAMNLMTTFETAKGKVLFIHVPKTGGSTITSELKHHHPIEMSANTPRPGYHCTPQHLHGAPLIEMFQSEALAYVFMVVRHPVDRICSEYNWNQRKRSIKVPFPLWLRMKLYQARKSPYHDDNHFRPQHEFVCLNTEVFRLEDGLDKVFRRLSEVTGARYSHNPEVRNEAGRFPPSVSKADRNLIEKFYANDFNQFGYDA